ncbi:MAG: ATP-binding protein [Desulfuromonadia bacterium]
MIRSLRERMSRFNRGGWIPLTLFLWFVLEILLLVSDRRQGGYHLPVIILFTLFAVLALERRNRSLRRRLETAEKSLVERNQEREKARRTYRALLEGGGSAIFIFDGSTGLLQDVNRKGLELLGYDREELLSITGRDLVDPASRDLFTALVHRVARRGRGKSEGITFVRRGGERIVLEIEARRLDLGDETLVYAVLRNITPRHRAEREIRQRNRELTILNTIIAHANESLRLESTLTFILQEVITAFGAEAGSIHLVTPSGNQRLAAIEGVTMVEGREITECRCPSSNSRMCVGEGKNPLPCCPVGEFAAAQGWGGVIGVPLFLRKRLVGTMHLIWRGEMTLTPDDEQFFVTLGNQIGIVIEHLRVFAELREKNDELSRSYRLLEKRTQQLTASQKRLRENLFRSEMLNREMERLDRMKNQFIGMISHEFRTPLTGILGSAELLLATDGGGDRGESDRSLIEIILTSGRRLNEIVTDLIKVAKLENRTLSIRLEPVDVRKLIQEVVSSFLPLAAMRGQRIRTDHVPDGPLVEADREYLSEVLSELVENAIKFTRDGGTIEIGTSLVGRDDMLSRIEIMERFSPGFFDAMGDRIFLKIEVRDSGIGIDYTEQTTIFEKFYEGGELRHHFSSKHQFLGKGAGIGLSIVKGLVEAHRGMVWVESGQRSPLEQNPGSSFVVLIPVEPHPSAPPPAVPSRRSADVSTPP